MESGEYDEWEIDVMNALLRVEPRLRGLYRYVKSYRMGGDILVFLETDSGIPEWLGQELSKELGSRVIVVEYSRDVRRLASKLLRPSRVLGLDRVYLPDGSTMLVVRVDVRPREGVEGLARRVLGMITGVEVSIEEVGAGWVEVRPDKEDVRRALDRLGL